MSHRPRLISAFVLTAALAPAAAPVPARGDDAAAENTLFELAVHPSFLDEMLQQPIRQERSIQEYVRGTIMRGTALTEGVLGVAAAEDRYALGVDLVLASRTTATTV